MFLCYALCRIQIEIFQTLLKMKWPFNCEATTRSSIFDKKGRLGEPGELSS